MKIIFTENAPKPIGPYSQAVMTDKTLYLSGQISLDPKTGAMIDGGIKEQTQAVIRNIQAVLAQAGLGFENVVKTTCFLASMDDFNAFNELYEAAFISKPARSCVEVGRLPKGALVEVEVIAER
jgi:2-iminobutanoate/2-iminopropanoate deaminase